MSNIRPLLRARPRPGRKTLPPAILLWLLTLSSSGFAAEATEAPLTLAEALVIAAAHNETPQIAAARVQQAASLLSKAWAQLVPELTLSGIYTRRSREVTREVGGEEVTIQAVDALNGSAVVDSTLLDLRAFPGIRSARHNLAGQQLDSTELNRALAFDVAESFFGLLSLGELRAAATRRVEVATATVEEARLRIGAGLASRNELTRTELELATATLSRTQAENGARSASLALGFLLGLPLDRPLAEPEAAALEPDDPEALAGRALAQRADLQALDERLQSLRYLAQVPRLGIVPTLDLRGTYRATNEAGLSGREQDWNVALTLTWELFDGGDRRADAALADAELREAELERAALARRIRLEVEQATTDFATAHAALAQAEVQSKVARQNAEEVRERFIHGLATGLEQADALVSAFEAEAEVARQGFAVRIAHLALSRALGEWPLPPGEPAAATARDPSSGSLSEASTR